MNLQGRFYSIINNQWFGWIVVILISIGVSVQNELQGIHHFWGGDYTYYNNYIIFKSSFIHLIENKNLYELYLKEYADFYKYSPTFALLMAPFYYLPNMVGLFLWNFLGCFLLYWSVRRIKYFNLKDSHFVLLFILLELILSTQSSQSNSLIAGLLIFSFNKFEENKPSTAALLIVIGAFIKIFAIVAAIMFLFYPKKFPFVLYMTLWTGIFFLAPLLVVSPMDLIQQYNNWLVLLNKDHSVSTGMSVYTIIWYFTGHVNKFFTLATGVLLLLLPLVKISSYKGFGFRLWYLSALLIWIVIFNHKGESPTYVIAMAGCGIWGVFIEKSRAITLTLLLTWILSSLIKTDLVPSFIRSQLNLNFINAFMPTVVFILIIIGLTAQSKHIRYKPIA